MKYVLNWHERPQGSALEYENVQKRILTLFRQWPMDSTWKIHSFVVRLGEWGGYILMECNDVAALHKFCSAFPGFAFAVNPVLDISDAVRVELEAIAWREGVAEG
ncbi:MAG: DUF3303 family protein [Phyllobacteriaceae bacterium]|nr:DUF3303 family protein [Phyllobacteriaceae bacterium]